MTEYSYSIQDATLGEIREIVNRSAIENNEILGKSSFVGDGKTREWYVAPPGFYIEPSSLSITVNDQVAPFTLDPVSGIVTMSSIPANGATGECSFTARAFSDFQIDTAINAAVSMLFPALYVTGTETLYGDGSTYEFALPDKVEVVTSIDRLNQDKWTRLDRAKRYSIYRDVSLCVRFFSAPSEQLRVHTIERPGYFTHRDQSLSSIGLPRRALDPLVAGAVYQLLLSKSAVRIRTDVAVATMGTGTVFPSMMSQIASSWMMRFQFQLNAVKMRPWISR